VIAKNIKTAEAGYKAAMEVMNGQRDLSLPSPLLRRGGEAKRPPKIVITGNDAVAMGAIAAGMQFASIYPMTPVSNILT
ncbi:hypothetical protein OE165_28560, partial [Escherichia coli]|uniref:hypothetical protein n=1 Tax=Escherichia coli TaxID=562 RepID=UPI0021F38E49